jgi:cytochrome c oxidase subunit I+III
MTARAHDSGLPEPVVGDVSKLPNHVFGPRDTMWWGTLSFMVIEGFTLSLCVIAYIYLIRKESSWPPDGTPLPDTLPFVLQALVLLVGVVAAYMADRAARRLDQQKLKWVLLASSVVGIASLVIRGFEFGALHVRWDENAYGSAIWVIVGFHTTLLLPDVIDGIALTVLAWQGPMRAKFITGASDNAYYWYFLAGTWILTSAILLLTPRFL